MADTILSGLYVYINWFHPPNNSVMQVYFNILILRKRKWSPERLSDLSKVEKLVNGEVRSWTQTPGS